MLTRILKAVSTDTSRWTCDGRAMYGVQKMRTSSDSGQTCRFQRSSLESSEGTEINEELAVEAWINDHLGLTRTEISCLEADRTRSSRDPKC